MNIFEVSVKVLKTFESGVEKRVVEKYLFNAVSFTEAESKAIIELSAFYDELEVCAEKRLNIAEIITSDTEAGDRYFRAKVYLITLDEKSGKEKKTKQEIIVQSTDIDRAKTALYDAMNSTIGDWVLDSLQSTEYIDYFKG